VDLFPDQLHSSLPQAEGTTAQRVNSSFLDRNYLNLYCCQSSCVTRARPEVKNMVVKKKIKSKS